LESLAGLDHRAPCLPIISTVTGKPVEGRQFKEDYWWRNVRQTVRFSDAVMNLIDGGYNTFLELSPHPVLSGSISECLMHHGSKGSVLPSMRRGEEEQTQLLSSLGALFTVGYPVDWHKLWPAGVRRLHLPRYPWQRERYWHESEESREGRSARKRHPLLGKNLGSADPTWENVLDKRQIRFLDDHRLLGLAVVPATAYVEMALGAARETLGEGALILEEFRFQKALFLPDGSEAPMTQLTVYTPDASFALHSRIGDSDQSWELHATGYMRAQSDPRTGSGFDPEVIKRNLPDQYSGEDLYKFVWNMGFHFGPSFRGIERIWRKDWEALGEIRLPEHLENESQDYCIHPALLDCCFQVGNSAFPLEYVKTNKNIFKAMFLPVHVEQIRYYATPGHRVWSHVRLTKIGPKTTEFDLHLYGEDGRLLMALENLRCQAVQGVRDDDSHDMERWLYEVNWYNKRRPEQQLVRRSPDYIPGSQEIARSVVKENRQIDRRFGWSKTAPKAEKQMNSLSVAYVLKAMRELGWGMNQEDSVQLDPLMERLKIAPRHRRLLERHLQMLASAGYLKKTGAAKWTVKRRPRNRNPQEIWTQTVSQYPSYLAELGLIKRCGSSLTQALRGEIDPSQLIFPEGSTEMAEHFYQDSPSFRFYNMMVQKVVSQALSRFPEGRAVRILEVGAGTGGITTDVLPNLPENRTDYVFSDLSDLFIAKAESKFHTYPFVEYQLLDIEKDPLQQAFSPRSFDLILASDVLHGTADLRDALGNILKLLSGGGLFVFLEREKSPYWVDMVFGLTEGWWRFGDFDLRPDYPLISRSKWKKILAEVGFVDIESITPTPDREKSGQVVMLARGPHIEEGPQPISKEVQPADQDNGNWLIFADKGGFAQRLAESLCVRGDTCTLVSHGGGFRRIDETNFEISADDPEDMQQLLHTVLPEHTAWRGTIHLWSLDVPVSEETTVDSLRYAEALGCYSVMHFVQTLEKSDKPDRMTRLLLVTKGAQPVGSTDGLTSVGQSLLIGLGKVLINEHPESHCKLVDLAFETTEDEIQSLLEELRSEDEEEEIVLRHDARFVPRLERATPKKVSVEELSVDGRDRGFRLTPSTFGVIDSLSLGESHRLEPELGQVEIEVFAASLNFRDVMKALGLYPTDSPDCMILGDECAGRIAAVGQGVENFEIGDEVVAVAPGCLGSYATTSSDLVIHKPKRLSFEDAATIPIVFLTAHYALHHPGQIRAGERVLIHSAAGGVGLAALQIAQHAGAEVFATAGSPEKRELLRLLGVEHVMDSRSLAFADEIMEATGGRGVDIVLNSLAGKAIAKGISSLAPGGRFLEIGKRDIYQNSKLGLWAFRKNLSFFAIDLGQLVADNPAMIQPLLGKLIEQFDNKEFHILPYRVFPVSRTADAFRHMAQAKHVGKIVISMRERNVKVDRLEEEKVALHSEATYLITGGFGGFGLVLAGWMIRNGARNLVLMGRKGAESEGAKRALAELQSTGAHVMEAKADVASQKEVAEVLAEIDRKMPPLRGIFHAAMASDDGILLQLNKDRIRQVTASKVDGTWNLHSLTLDKQLDYFFLFSSLSSLVGTRGQANYVAANTFLDTFAYYRRSLGLPAISINWGTLAEVGYFSSHQELAESLRSKGVIELSPDQAIEALSRMLQRNPIQMGVMRMDWQKLARLASKVKTPRRLSSLMSDNPDQQGGEGGGRVREAILDAAEEQREEMLRTYLREQVARVLGASPAKLDVDQPLNELGLDSLMAVELRNRVEVDLGTAVPVTLLLQRPSLARLAKQLLEQLTSPAAAPAATPLSRKESAEELLGKVDQLSDEEVDSLLSEMVEEETDDARPVNEDLSR
jgi:NADPH:quinone reductase-like Zn-dependent oxidoreductase/SAM-dependent methyltransferase/aryl carrier-like protein